MDARKPCDPAAFYGYLYWLSGSRAGAMALAQQVALLQPRQPQAAERMIERLRIATQLAAALPEERRRPGWLPPAHGPQPPSILVGLASLSIEQRAVLLLSFGLNLSDEDLQWIAPVTAGDALTALTESFGGQRDVAIAELQCLPWPLPAPGEALALESFNQIETEQDPVYPPGARNRGVIVRPALLGIVAVIAVAGRLLLVSSGARREGPVPAASPAVATPVETAAFVTAPAGTSAPLAVDDGRPSAAGWLLANGRQVTGSELRQVVGDARVVVIGDGTWGASGTAEFLQERLRITQILVDEMGFDVVIMQIPEPEGLIAGSFVQSSGVDQEVEAVARALEAPWPPLAELAVFRWLHEHKTVTVAGFLPSTGVFDETAPRAIEDFLEAVDPENAYRLNADRQGLQAFLAAQQDVYGALDPERYHRVLTLARGMVQHDLLVQAGDSGEAGGLYEQFVRENLNRELEEAGKRPCGKRRARGVTRDRRAAVYLGASGRPDRIPLWRGQHDGVRRGTGGASGDHAGTPGGEPAGRRL